VSAQEQYWSCSVLEQDPSARLRAKEGVVL
jgi:hypothetical protein